MRIAHVADPHLGLRRYHRTNPGGANAREVDVMAAFAAAIDQIIAAKVDAVLIPGDLFDSVRPGNACIIEAFRHFRRLTHALPGVPVIIASGNHETPRSTDAQVISDLLAELPCIQIISRQSAAVRVGDLSVRCWPHGAAFNEAMPPEIDASAKWNVFLAHIDINAERKPWTYSNWDAVLLGDWHVFRQLEAHVAYAGSLEYVSTNPWGELKEETAAGIPGKGWVLWTLRDREFPLVEFQPVPTRAYVDLPLIDAATRTAAEVDLLVAEQFRTQVLAGAVVRQVITNCPRGFAGQLNHDQIRQHRMTALHFQLDTRRSVEVRPLMAATSALTRPGRRLTDIVIEYLERRPLPAGLERERFVALGRSYMEAVDAEAAASAK